MRKIIFVLALVPFLACGGKWVDVPYVTCSEDGTKMEMDGKTVSMDKLGKGGEWSDVMKTLYEKDCNKLGKTYEDARCQGRKLQIYCN